MSTSVFPPNETALEVTAPEHNWEELVGELTQKVREKLGEWVEMKHNADSAPSTEEQRQFVGEIMGSCIQELSLGRLNGGLDLLDSAQGEKLSEETLGQIFGAGLWEKYLNSKDLSDVHINGCDSVWLVDRQGNKRRGEPAAKSNQELIEQIRWAASQLGRTARRFDTNSPILNMRLPGGARMHAIMDVATEPLVTLRFHAPELASLDLLYKEGMFDAAMHSFLAAAVKSRQNIVICGGMGTGKTTLCRALLNEAFPDERIITVEDELELGLEYYEEFHPDIGVLESRPPNLEGAGGIPLEALLRECLRMHADRIVVGEVRGPEVLGMLLAMTSGQRGSLCTIHANSTKEAFERLAMYSSMTSQQYSQAFTYRLVGSAVDFVIHLDHIAGKRRITSIREVLGATENQVQSNEIWQPGPDGRAVVSGEPLRVEPTLRMLSQQGFDRQIMDQADNSWVQ